MSNRINKLLVFIAIFSIVAFLVIAGFSPVFAAETTEEAVENEKTISSGLEWLKSLSVDEIKGWIGAGIAFIASGVGSIIILVIKIAYDSVKKAKMQAELKEVQTEADKKIIDLCNKFTESEQATQDKVIEMMHEFADQYNIKLSKEVNESVEAQKKVLDKYAAKIKEAESKE